MQAAHLLRADLPESGRILTALSGGADSVALLVSLYEEIGAERLAAAHVNHCLRGAESDRDESFCRSLCEKLGIPLAVARRDVNAERRKGESVEDAARRIRYEELTRAAKLQNCEFIATAHNANDNAETLLLNLVRGAGGAGMAGIPHERDLGDGIRVIRPLLGTTRGEIETFLEERNIGHVEDSTNASTDYTRNLIRHQVMPRLAEANSATVTHLNAAAEMAREDEEYLLAEAEKLFDAAVADIPKGFTWNMDGAAAHVDANASTCQRADTQCAPVALSVATILAAPRPIALRALRLAHTRAGGPSLTRAHTEALYRLCASADPSASLDLPRGSKARRVYGALVITRDAETYTPTVTLTETVAPKQKNTHGFDPVRPLYLRADAEYTIRPRTLGDTFSAAGRGWRKSLKKLMVELKIPAALRDSFPLVIAPDGRVAALPGFAVGEDFTVSEGETAVEIRLVP